MAQERSAKRDLYQASLPSIDRNASAALPEQRGKPPLDVCSPFPALRGFGPP